MLQETDNSNLSYPFHPWRRYFARSLDILIYSIIWSVFLAFIFRVNVADRNTAENVLDTLVEFIMMLFLEPLWLHYFGTTPGKFIFGLRIENKDGDPLSYSEGLERTIDVIGIGMGFNIPIYNLIRLWKSYRQCSENEILPWDEYTSYTIKDTNWYRGLIYIVAHVICFASLTVIMSAQLMPPNKGDLTVAQFAENYNYYANILDLDSGNEYMDETGEWKKKKTDDYTIYLGLNKKPEFSFTTKDGYVTGVSFAIDADKSESVIYPYDDHMLLSSLAFACAQNNNLLSSRLPNRIEKKIKNNLFEDFSFTEAGIRFVCDVEYSGYIKTPQYLIFPSDTSKHYFNLNFSMSK